MNGFRLMRVMGITVSVHWSWLPVAILMTVLSDRRYDSMIWNVGEYLSLFAIVLLHEFGHLLACRSVGGKGDYILLWPLGGIAYGQPPDRPGPTLWTIVGGPLVNVLLFPILWFATVKIGLGDSETAPTNVQMLAHRVYQINAALLIFNLMPVFPLDGGQMLRSLLWFPFGKARSLQIASTLGLMLVIPAFFWAIQQKAAWLTIMAVFLAMQAYQGFRLAQAMLRAQREAADESR